MICSNIIVPKSYNPINRVDFFPFFPPLFSFFSPIAIRLTRLALFQGVQTESQLRMQPRHALQAEDQPCQGLWLEALNDYCKPLNIIICISPPPNVLHV